MRPADLRRGPALAAALVLSMAGCASPEAARQAEAARVAAEAAALAARTPPPVQLNNAVVEAASVYVAFTRDIGAMEGGFTSAQAVQAALRRGASYDPAQLSRGMVAYASILALQSPEFVEGVRQYAVDRTVREELAANIAADPRWASHLPGADRAAGLIMSTMRDDIEALGNAADSIENDAYAIQNSWDPRRSWGVAHVTDREGRLADAKARSTEVMPASPGEAARLSAAVQRGSGLGASAGEPRRPPYPEAVEKALAIAALAALGAAGEEASARTASLMENPGGEACLSLSKLMLFQCLAAARPSYEDMFCIGRHVARDLETCTRGSAMPAAVVTVSNVRPTDGGRARPAISVAPLEPAPTPRPDVTPGDLNPAPRPRPAPAPPPPATAPAQPDRPLTPTERLNTSPGG